MPVPRSVRDPGMAHTGGVRNTLKMLIMHQRNKKGEKT